MVDKDIQQIKEHLKKNADTMVLTSGVLVAISKVQEKQNKELDQIFQLLERFLNRIELLEQKLSVIQGIQPSDN